jgi:hypothetical protein
LEVVRDVYLCSLIFPAFWLIKKRNRLRFNDLQGRALADRVARDIANTQDSLAFRLFCRIEEWLMTHRVFLPFGIRCLTVVKRPGECK